MELHITCLLALKTHAQKSCFKKKKYFSSPIAIKGCFFGINTKRDAGICTQPRC